MVVVEDRMVHTAVRNHRQNHAAEVAAEVAAGEMVEAVEVERGRKVLKVEEAEDALTALVHATVELVQVPEEELEVVAVSVWVVVVVEVEVAVAVMM